MMSIISICRIHAYFGGVGGKAQKVWDSRSGVSFHTSDLRSVFSNTKESEKLKIFENC